MIVAGADGCKGGWVVVLGRALKTKVRPFGAFVVSALDEIPSLDDTPEVLAIDIPINLPVRAEPGGRACDRHARILLGSRASSVFSPPVRAALACATYEEALEVNRASSEHALGITIQCWNIVPKIREAAAFVASSRVRTVEAHPEVCFRAMVGGPMTHPKRTPLGRAERLDALGHAIGDVPDPPGGHAPDDLLDACACLWTSWRVAMGRALVLPDTPDDSGGYIHA